MVSQNPKARPLPEIAGRFERSPFLAESLQLSDELAIASGCHESIDPDPDSDEPEQPSFAMMLRLARAIRACKRDIVAEKPRERKRTIEITPEEAAAVRRFLATPGATLIDAAWLFEVGVDVVRKIANGDWKPKRAKIRCAGCGGSLTSDDPCLLCAVAHRPNPRAAV